jgi:hypothetical protein
MWPLFFVFRISLVVNSTKTRAKAELVDANYFPGPLATLCIQRQGKIGYRSSTNVGMPDFSWFIQTIMSRLSSLKTFDFGSFVK